MLLYEFITYLFYSQAQQIPVSTGTGKSLNHPDICLHCSWKPKPHTISYQSGYLTRKNGLYRIVRRYSHRDRHQDRFPMSSKLIYPYLCPFRSLCLYRCLTMWTHHKALFTRNFSGQYPSKSPSKFNIVSMVTGRAQWRYVWADIKSAVVALIVNVIQFYHYKQWRIHEGPGDACLFSWFFFSVLCSFQEKWAKTIGLSPNLWVRPSPPREILDPPLISTLLEILVIRTMDKDYSCWYRRHKSVHWSRPYTDT